MAHTNRGVRSGVKTVKVGEETLTRGSGGELHQTADGDTPVLTTNLGSPVSDDQNSLKIGPRGALVLDPLMAVDLQHEFDSATPVGRCRYPVKQMQAAWTGAEDLPSESEEASLNTTVST